MAQDFGFTTALEKSMFTRPATFFLNSLDISYPDFSKRILRNKFAQIINVTRVNTSTPIVGILWLKKADALFLGR